MATKPTKIFLFLPQLPAGATNYRERHPYGPGTAGTFETDLSIEIRADRQPIPFSAILAICGGIVRFMPITDQGMIVLQPRPREKKDILSTLGISGSLLFIYRHVDKSAVATAATEIIKNLGSKGFPSGETPQSLGSRFANGEFWLNVEPGAVIGQASTIGSATGWADVGFEIVLIPGGIIFTGTSDGPFNGWQRIRQLITPSAETRRMDPMAFYATIARGAGPATLDASHTNHVLLTLPTRRTLIEVRDEYDRPFTGLVTITKGTEAPVTAPPPAGSRGTFVVDSVPAIGPPASFAYSIAIPDQIFTDLPSGNEAMSTPSRTMVAPSHWATQTIFMSPSPEQEDDEKGWFVANTDGLPRFTCKNKVTVLRDGVDTFREYVKAIRTLTDSTHFLELAGWILIDDFELVPRDPSSTFRFLCQAATTPSRGAEVRALLWDDSTLQGNVNSAPVNRINALPGGRGRAILDDEAPGLAGAHHQKMLIVNGLHGALAFCGGIDINSDRVDSQNHGALGAFHDVHAKFEGDAVNNIHRTFFRRFNNHPTNPTPIVEGTLPVASNPGTVFVEIARTFSPSFTRTGRYPFVQPDGGSLTPYNLVRRAIQRARKFIYIEDQYFTPYPGTNPANASDDTFLILTDLRDALTRIDHLIIVIPNHCDQPQNRYRRQQAILALMAVDPIKVQVFSLGRNNAGTSPLPQETAKQGGSEHSSGGPEHRTEIYCHSKVWIVDDVVAKIGSANFCRRSYSSDTEIDAVMCDEAVENGARRWVKQFRMDLWGEHLNLPGAKRSMLEDIEHAVIFFRNLPTGARLRTYDHNAEIGLDHDPVYWNGVDPDGR